MPQFTQFKKTPQSALEKWSLMQKYWKFFFILISNYFLKLWCYRLIKIHFFLQNVSLLFISNKRLVYNFINLVGLIGFKSGSIFQLQFYMLSMEQCALKNVNNCLNTDIYSYLETYGGRSFNLYLNVVHFFNTSTYVAA